MRTPAQIEASRLNGAKSHGPITPEGKQRSSQNAVKHGLTARTVVLCAENHELFEQLEQDYVDSLQPATILELHLVQRIAVAEWRLRRAWAVSTAITDKCLQDHKAQDDRENRDCDNDFRIGINQQRVHKELASVERAEARFERTQARALAEFHRLRKLRPPDAQPIQVSRPDVSTTGRDPAQYTSDPNQSNQPRPKEAEPCIVIPHYPKSLEEEMDLDQPPGLPLAS
jgi:hypothetical protein